MHEFTHDLRADAQILSDHRMLALVHAAFGGIVRPIRTTEKADRKGADFLVFKPARTTVQVKTRRAFYPDVLIELRHEFRSPGRIPRVGWAVDYQTSQDGPDEMLYVWWPDYPAAAPRAALAWQVRDLTTGLLAAWERRCRRLVRADNRDYVTVSIPVSTQEFLTSVSSARWVKDPAGKRLWDCGYMAWESAHNPSNSL